LTAEVPIYWEQIEPVEGAFDFAIVDDLIAGARDHGLKLIPLWFGTW
jgi:GH35 family endo-1,4-beta-xylanase